MENYEKEFQELLEQEELNYYSKGEIVEGEIVRITNDYAFVDIGQKTEAVVKKDELEGLNIGDKIKAVYTGKKTPEGYSILSRKPIRFKEALENVEKALNENLRINAKLIKNLEKGFIVDLNGIKAFLPYSESGLRKGENLPEEFEVYVLKLDKNRKVPNIVVSRKKVLQEEQQKKKEKLFSELEQGMSIPAKVVKIQDNGVVLSVGNIVFGFLPASLYSWDKNKSIKELKKGQEIEVFIKELDKENQKLILSRKDLEENPWEKFPYQVGDKVKAVVKKINDYGLIVKVDNLQGFIHKSETDHLYPNKFKEKFKEGSEVEAVIIELDRENQKLKLSIKQAHPHPLDKFLEEHPEGSEVEGKIKDVKNKVAFIDLGEIEGILHLEDATWNPKIKNIGQVLKGKKVEKFKVLGKEKDKIKLGLKQFKENPWDIFLSKYKVGDYVKGKVIKMIDRGAFVVINPETFGNDIEGFIPVNEISKERIEIPSDKLSLNQEIEAKIIKIKGHDIILSIKALEKDKEKKEIEKVIEKVKPKGEGLGTLGELLKEKLKEKNK
ncbi:S1 RNA-binding domain-containing protein [Hydrogenothermus marinus]|uniref:SSU ribosomal protein S1P n=1 Tax=Hydrogenothermus marinus TaxID=133270 RepID=A0A3M0BHE0_9AQUI|nr:S1 RNA-binding domain-containing protein [Hydrogenothermus marinus]RMA95996.1 SSU ribosomal protein S1P [Hydrogenothermus marinus]